MFGDVADGLPAFGEPANGFLLVGGGEVIQAYAVADPETARSIAIFVDLLVEALRRRMRKGKLGEPRGVALGGMLFLRGRPRGRLWVTSWP